MNLATLGSTARKLLRESRGASLRFLKLVVKEASLITRRTRKLPVGYEVRRLPRRTFSFSYGHRFDTPSWHRPFAHGAARCGRVGRKAPRRLSGRRGA